MCLSFSLFTPSLPHPWLDTTSSLPKLQNTIHPPISCSLNPASFLLIAFTPVLGAPFLYHIVLLIRSSPYVSLRFPTPSLSLQHYQPLLLTYLSLTGPLPTTAPAFSLFIAPLFTSLLSSLFLLYILTSYLAFSSCVYLFIVKVTVKLGDCY